MDVAFSAPFPSTIYPHLSLILNSIGLLLMAWFFTMQVSAHESSNDVSQSSYSLSVSKLLRELSVALVACCFIGFGLLFLALNVGLYV